MSRKIREATIEDQADIDMAIYYLRAARDNLLTAHAIRAVAAVRRALKSAEGAQRHVYHRIARTK